MKLSFSISRDWDLILLAAFLFSIPLSIAVAFVFFSILAIRALVLLKKTNKPGPFPIAFKVIPLFCLLTLISTLFSYDFRRSLADNKELFHFLLIPILVLMLRTASRLRFSLQAVFLSMTVSVCIGLAEWLRKGTTTEARLKGATSHWMTYAGSLMLAFIFFLIYLLMTGRRREWLLILPVLIMSGGVIALSLTRNAWLGIAVSLFLFLICCKRRWLIAVVPIGLAAFFLLPSPVKQRISSIIDLNDPSNRDRIHMLYTGWHIFRDHPWTGAGPDTIPLVYHRYRHPQASQDNPHLHNNLMQLLAERGIFTALVFLLFCVLYLADLIRTLRQRRGRAKVLSLAALFAFVAFLVSGFFEYNFGDTEIRFLLLYFLTIPYLPISEDEYDQDEAIGRDLFSIS